MAPLVALDTYSVWERTGRVAGRLIFLAVIPVLAIAFAYWLSGRSRPQPMPFTHAISRWWVWGTGLLAGFLLLFVLASMLVAPAAQRQSTLDSGVAAVQAPAVPDGWTMQRDATNGFELALPAGWATARADPAFFNSDVATIGQAHPNVADALRRVNQAMSGKGLKLMAVDPAESSVFQSNMLLLMYDAGFGPSLDSAAKGYVSGIEENTTIQKPVTQAKVTLPVGSAVRVEAHTAPVQGVTVTSVSYLTLHAKQGKSLGVIVIFSGSSDQMPALQITIKQVVESFRYVS